MNATAAPTTRRFARTLLAVLAVAVAMTMLQSAPASAYTTRTSGSYPGRVDPYVIQGSHYDTCTSNYYTCFTPWVVGTGPMVYRSPASNGTQSITAVYQLQRYNGSGWVNHSQQIYTRYLYAGYSRLQMPRIDFLPNAGGHFRIVMGIAWSNRYQTVGYGARKLVFNHAGDYICNTRFPCQRGDGWVWLRSPGV